MDEFEEKTEKSLLKQSSDYAEVGDANEVTNNDAGVHVVVDAAADADEEVVETAPEAAEEAPEVADDEKEA
jgi:hypothetical protein